MFFHFSDGTAYQVLVAGYDPNSHCPSSPSPVTPPSPGLGGPGTIQKHLELAPFIESMTAPGQTTTMELKLISAALIRLADKAFERRSSVSTSHAQAHGLLPSPRTRKVSRQLTSSSNTSSEDQDMEHVRTVRNEERDTDADIEMDTADSSPSTPIPAFSEQKWNQHHMSLALKFEGVDGWHCISAIMQSRPSHNISSNAQSNGFFSQWKLNGSNTNLSSPMFLSPPPDANGEIFRSYEDVYIIRVADRQSPSSPTGSNGNGNGPAKGGSARKNMKHMRQNSEWSEWSFGSS